FDAYLAGDQADLNKPQKQGLELFFGKAQCSTCHSGPLMTDQSFHALGLPPFGPGRTRRFDPMVRDVGRMGESDALEDAYAFKTPMLRNVALTAPYGHNGAYPTLEGIVRHHLEPLKSLDNWTRDMAALPSVPWLEPIDFMVWQDSREMARQRAVIQREPVLLSDTEVDEIVAFLHALTGKGAQTDKLGIPASVPSGLPVDPRIVR
ncbi:MAG: methylamine utilization protein MauG, partial [Pseudomonadota bacterium]